MDQNVSVHSKRLAQRLIDSQQSLSVAESCTGGWLSKVLTDSPGSSAWFLGGIVSYSNHAKQELLHVSEKDLVEYGAVSAQVAESMAEGAMQTFNTSLSVSITGVAGPDGGSKKKPVGSVFFGVKREGKAAYAIQKKFDGSRNVIRQKAVETALQLLLDEAYK